MKYSAEFVQYRYRISVMASDRTQMAQITVFGGCLDRFFGTSATSFMRFDCKVASPNSDQPLLSLNMFIMGSCRFYRATACRKFLMFIASTGLFFGSKKKVSSLDDFVFEGGLEGEMLYCCNLNLDTPLCNLNTCNRLQVQTTIIF